MDLMVEATARRVFSNAHTYHINSISVNSDLQTFISTDDLRVNLWNLEITDRSFSILLLGSFLRVGAVIVCRRMWKKWVESNRVIETLLFRKFKTVVI